MSAAEPTVDDYVSLVAGVLAATESSRPARPALPPGRRGDAARLLAWLLVRPAVLDDYAAVADAEVRKHPEAARATEAARETFPVERVVEAGLGALSDEELAALALDTIQLGTLAELLEELADANECGTVWLDLIAEVGPPPGPGPLAAPPIVVLVARPTAGTGGPDAEEPTSWDLGTDPPAARVPLPEAVARSCYRTPDQAVSLQLHREPTGEGQWDVWVEVSPPPSALGLMVIVPFRDGSRLTFPVPPERAACVARAAWSERAGPLPDAAFGAEDWALPVRFAPAPSPPPPEAGLPQLEDVDLLEVTDTRSPKLG